ncbi:MAG: polyprenyl synthetase family protein [Legionella sp.]|nr:polyprenyl synthetase family protein [Legionella sp.]
MSLEPSRLLVSQEFDAVNALILDTIQPHIGLIDELSNHIVQSGGKRLRPLIVLLVSKACGYQGQLHIPLAALIEFIHTATLLHDDVVDESTLRRGQQTANSIWGDKASILVGDFLFTQSMQLAIEVGDMEIIKIITETSLKIISGEVKQLSNRHNPHLSFEDYFEIIRSKTALLFAAAAQIAAQVSGVSPSVQQSLYTYGLHLGNAFQLADDILDYCADALVLGKNIGDDLADGKATMPLIYAFQQGSAKQKLQIKTSLTQGNLDCLPDILKTIEDTKAIDYSKGIAQEEIDKAVSALNCLPDSDYKQALKDLATFALQRNH